MLKYKNKKGIDLALLWALQNFLSRAKFAWHVTAGIILHGFLFNFKKPDSSGIILLHEGSYS